MSKSKREKESIKRGIEEQNDYYKKKNEEKKIRKDDPARPNLLKRVASILLDAVIIVVTIAGLYLLATVTIFHPLKYYEYRDTATQINMNSGLYNEKFGENLTYSTYYDKNLSPEENLDKPMIKFYSTYEYAIANDKLNKYNQAKLNSGLYVLNEENVIVRKEGVSDGTAKGFLLTQYDAALDYLHSNPDYIIATNYTYNVVIFTVIVCTMISFTFFYLTIPFITKEHVSIGQLACGLACVNSEDKRPSTKKQIFIRFIIIYLMNGFVPIGLFTLWGFEAIGFPFLIVMIMISFTKTNSGPHDYLSHTKIINKSRSNAFEVLESMKEQTDSQRLNEAHYYNDRPEEEIHYTDED